MKEKVQAPLEGETTKDMAATTIILAAICLGAVAFFVCALIGFYRAGKPRMKRPRLRVEPKSSATQAQQRGRLLIIPVISRSPNGAVTDSRRVQAIDTYSPGRIHSRRAMLR